MTRDQAVDWIQRMLGFRTDLESEIIEALQLAQTQLEASPTKPWFLVTEYNSRRLTIGEERLAIPDNFIAIVEDSTLVYVPDDATLAETLLFKDDLDKLQIKYKNTASGPPVDYAIAGTYFRIFPTPDDEYYIKMLNYKTDTVLTTDVTNGWLTHAPFALIGKAGRLIAMSIRDKNAVEAFSMLEKEGLTTLYN